MTDPLDRPIWHALAGRSADFAVGDGAAKRFAPDVEPFIASIDDRPASLAALAPLFGEKERLIFMQAGAAALPPGIVAVETLAGVQMIGENFDPCDPPPGLVALGDADAAEMVALAAATRPGPFLPRTHRLGDFFGVRDAAGRLVAMAGERLKLDGMSEISGVCTAPEARGEGHAERLCRHVASQIVRRGETPFLHTFAANHGAIRLYRRMGFALRREMVVTIAARRT